jgi:putative sugar O-methyltransferase
MWEVNKEWSEPFLLACKDSASNDIAFKNFRRDERFYSILEHVTYDEGVLYIKERLDTNICSQSFKDLLSKMLENDRIGNPVRYDYLDIGLVCPTTLRYIKNLYDIASMIDASEPKFNNIVEIGGGYGGLCRMLKSIFSINNYLLIDFSEVNQLSKRYLSEYYTDKILWMTPETFSNVNNVDLCISNYAFSECDRKIQNEYYEKVIKKSKMFYITYNNISDRNMSFNEFHILASQTFDIKVQKEERESHTNYVMFGNNREYFN